MQGFTKIRNGLLDHALAGKLSPFDFGLYVFLIMRANYSTGIYEGCALTIAYQFGDPSLKEHVQKSLRRLRDKKYINYRKGDGSRGAYSILINKFDVTLGKLSGYRLDAWKHNGLARPEYAPRNGGATLETLSWHGDGTVVAPNEDLKTEDLEDGKTLAPQSPEKRSTRIPETFTVTASHRAFAIENGLPAPELELERFKDHFRAMAGPSAVKKNWDAAFRNWLRTAAEIRSRNGNGGSNAKPSMETIVDREQAILRSRRTSQ